MPLFGSRKRAPADRISSDALASFGRFEFLGADQSGVDPGTAYGLVEPLNQLIYTQDPADRAALIAELRRHAAVGEWERVGAWKYVRQWLSEDAETVELIDGGLRAISRMKVANLAIHLAPVDRPRFEHVNGGPPANNGFFGPPVFETEYGPTKQYYLDHAVRTAALRNVERVPSAPGVAPGPLVDATRAMWDFAMLIHRGPLVVSEDCRFEPSLVRVPVAAATNVDHAQFVDGMAAELRSTAGGMTQLWNYLGAARFAEDYLDYSAVNAAGWTEMLDAGLLEAMKLGWLGTSFSAEVLTPRQRDRLAQLGG